MGVSAVSVSIRGTVLLLAAAPLLAGPVEFGIASVKRALAERGLAESAAPLRTAIAEGKPECYTVTSGTVSGSDQRGLMYGLLEAADQIRSTGRVANATGCPAVAMRGIRYFLHNQDLEKNWYYSTDYWDRYFEMLARNRF